MGDPDRGAGMQQPGGWIFNSLPYMEQQSLRDLQSGQTGVARLNACRQMISTPLPVTNCPTRRPLACKPASTQYPQQATPLFSSTTTQVAVGDYAANGGDLFIAPDHPSTGWTNTGPASWSDAESVTGIARFGILAAAATGVVYVGSTIHMADISDGTSNTIYCGDKFLAPDDYFGYVGPAPPLGVGDGDNEAMYMGGSFDVVRFGDLAPCRTWTASATRPIGVLAVPIPAVSTVVSATARCVRSATRSPRRFSADCVTARTVIPSMQMRFNPWKIASYGSRVVSVHAAAKTPTGKEVASADWTSAAERLWRVRRRVGR